ncbi:hypothetical protein K435DRAFT_690313, partial [Dendrothele bispora CBS 962.96]
KFTVGIKTGYCLQNMILYARINGLGFDSSYRNKNENRALVTFLVTVDQYKRMLPGPVFVSGDVKRDTLSGFLQEVKQLVEEMAARIVEDPSIIDSAHHANEVAMLTEATIIVQGSDGWQPLFFMIDKCLPEVGAILLVWPKMTICLCQFHVIQAILRWQTDSGTSEVKPKLSRPAKYLILWAFRQLQRARNEEAWKREVELFRQRLRKIVSKTNAYHIIRDYFEKNWFCGEWRDLWADIGLPPGHNRDNISTNNFTERAFKLFDEIFLENRANKSAYRLVLIIANEWFEYFRHWQPDHKKRPGAAYHQMILDGHRLWNSGYAIQDAGHDDQGQRVFKVLAEM